MKHIKKFENIDWDNEWDFEEEPISNGGEEYILAYTVTGNFEKFYYLVNKKSLLNENEKEYKLYKDYNYPYNFHGIFKLLDNIDDELLNNIDIYIHITFENKYLRNYQKSRLNITEYNDWIVLPYNTIKKYVNIVFK